MTDPDGTERECVERILRDLVPFLAHAERGGQHWRWEAKVLLDRVLRMLNEHTEWSAK